MPREGFPVTAWCALPQAYPLSGSLRSMLTTIPLNFPEECYLERKNSGSKAAKGIFCAVILPFPHRPAMMHRVLQRICGRLGAGNHCGGAHPTCVQHCRRGRESFGKDYVQLQIPRATAPPHSCCTGTLPVKRWGQCLCCVRSSKTPPGIHRRQGAPLVNSSSSADDAVSCFMEW